MSLVFQGASALALDAKGRLAVPARHRDVLIGPRYIHLRQLLRRPDYGRGLSVELLQETSNPLDAIGRQPHAPGSVYLAQARREPGLAADVPAKLQVVGEDEIA